MSASVPIVSIPTQKYSQAWLAWFLVSAGGFAALEFYAIRTEAFEHTLSRHTRRIFGIHPKRRWTPFGQAAFIFGLGAFNAWFAYHIVFEIEMDQTQCD